MGVFASLFITACLASEGDAGLEWGQPEHETHDSGQPIARTPGGAEGSSDW
ncbi:hypothetical protein [Azorhizobium doebereinerae]|uniref:hypothetical protein n=1 Tax=Azorhizobium doebereinerae TaxID=281091 RepID=UPI0012EBF9A8|nr:hypothetical protein [Azorhizobium doebereinerae]